TSYYELLNCGIRVAPSAGSGSSNQSGNPLGYNRVYVHCGDAFTWDNWWHGLRQGRSMITNGPMLRPRVNGELPGHVFHGYAGETVRLTPTLNLSTRERITYLQIVKNGETAAEVRLDELAKQRGQLPEIEFTESGWMLIRAVCDNQKAFRYATTAPYYVEFDGAPNRISRRSCKFFLDWTTERIAELEQQLSGTTKKQRDAVLKYHRAGLKFWTERRESANAP
ncbi:MAG: CehA/McbA family metallohydrolase, partial [Planctomycetales bacterium]|nr:CehA/McbA family metallohydrolase [Planctomycetales bacterium]